MSMSLKFKEMRIGNVIKLGTWILISLVLGIFLYYKYEDINMLIGALVMGIALTSYFHFSKEDVFNPIGVYSVFWLGVAGLANIRISSDQHIWSYYMWVVVILAFVSFCLGYFVMNKYNKKLSLKKPEVPFSNEKLYNCIFILFIISVVSFIFEAIYLGFIPIFSSKMDAYMNFNIKGVHYFVVSIALIPSLTLAYRKAGGTKKIIIYNIVSFLIPILIVSRQLLLLEIILAMITYHYSIKKIPFRIIFVTAIISIVLFSLSSNLRHQNIEYIKSAANVNIKSNSVLIQPYLYLTINFENLRNIVENFSDYKLGENTGFSVLAFTNTKKYVDFSYKSLYFTNPNFNTSTYLSDIYFDFGIVGVAIIPFMLGLLYCFLYKKYVRNNVNQIMIILYSLLSYCLIFSFFVCWYFNPTIVFYIVMLFIILFYCSRNKLKVEQTKVLK